MPDRMTPNIRIEKISLEWIGDMDEAFLESSQQWFAEGMIYESDTSIHEMETGIKNFQELWKKDQFCMFEIVVRPDNPASLMVAGQAGAVREALLRNRLRHHGCPRDAFMHY